MSMLETLLIISGRFVTRMEQLGDMWNKIQHLLLEPGIYYDQNSLLEYDVEPELLILKLWVWNLVIYEMVVNLNLLKLGIAYFKNTLISNLMIIIKLLAYPEKISNSL